MEPLKTIRDNVSPIEVAKYYLKVEFSSLFPDAPFETIASGIDALQDKNVFPLLEAMSFTYRLNGVAFNISRENHVWKEEVWDITKLIFTGMDLRANKVLFSDEINGDAIKFKEYLLNYFKTHTDTDPEGLFGYKQSGKEIHFPILIMKEQDNKPHMLDGSHRLTEMLLNGATEITAYVAHILPTASEEPPKVAVSGSNFILMTAAYKRGDTKQREAVISVVKQLIDRSISGTREFKKYWIDQQRDEEIKTAGEALLASLDK